MTDIQNEPAVCVQCAKDEHLKKLIEAHPEDLECSICGEADSPAIGVTQLGALIEPIMRDHFQPGPTVRRFAENDKDWWDQEGDPISWIVQTVLGQEFDIEDDIVQAVVDAEDVRPQDGEDAYWDDTLLYVETRASSGHYVDEWWRTLDELKHGRRFFSPAAQALFTKLFAGIERQTAWVDGKFKPIVSKLPTGTALFRARTCKSRSMLADIVVDPFKHVGPPPKEVAAAGRMNAEGVSVLYCAMERDTCLAEMRPALGNELAVISVQTSKPLRVLDFARLEARSGRPLSYLQSDFTQEVEKRDFLRKLHSLVSQPIAPGHEADYLITQTMAEYLAHVHSEPLDGVIFASAQRAGGRNVVLFAKCDLLDPSAAESFSVSFVDGSLGIHATKTIEYSHEELRLTLGSKGEVYLHDEADENYDQED